MTFRKPFYDFKIYGLQLKVNINFSENTFLNFSFDKKNLSSIVNQPFNEINSTSLRFRITFDKYNFTCWHIIKCMSLFKRNINPFEQHTGAMKLINVTNISFVLVFLILLSLFIVQTKIVGFALVVASFVALGLLYIIFNNFPRI